MKIVFRVFIVIFMLVFCAQLNGAVSPLEKELLSASGTLRIADAIGNDPAVYRAALAWAAANKNVEISIEQVPLLDVMERKMEKEYDFAVYISDPKNSFELVPDGVKTCYAIEPAIIYVSNKNEINNIALTSLSSVFCGDYSSWDMINSQKYSIRRYGVVFPVAGERTFRRLALGQLAFTDSMQRVASAAEVVAGVSGSEYAIGFAGYSYALPDTVKAIAVDGIAPSPSNLQNGSYPLMLNRMGADFGSSGLGGLFAKLLTSQEVGEILMSENLFPAGTEKQDK